MSKTGKGGEGGSRPLSDNAQKGAILLFKIVSRSKEINKRFFSRRVKEEEKYILACFSITADTDNV